MSQSDEEIEGSPGTQALTSRKCDTIMLGLDTGSELQRVQTSATVEMEHHFDVLVVGGRQPDGVGSGSSEADFSGSIIQDILRVADRAEHDDCVLQRSSPNVSRCHAQHDTAVERVEVLGKRVVSHIPGPLEAVERSLSISEAIGRSFH